MSHSIEENPSLHGPELEPPGRRRRALLAFTFANSGFQAQPQRVFLPRGLAIYGAPAGATVECHVGCGLQAIASWGDVPARFFASDLSFQQIAAKLDSGAEPPAWVQWDPCGIGNLVTIRVFEGLNRLSRSLGPEDGVQIVMWGVADWDCTVLS